YGSLSWIFCYDDNCLIHLSSKEGSEWFPQKPRRHRQIAIAGRGYTLSTTMSSNNSDCSDVTERSIQALEEGLNNGALRHSPSPVPDIIARDMNKGWYSLGYWYKYLSNIENASQATERLS
ncbi:hypothetical protein M406DRAFT_263123, partial [Cryphonectria parasitica EP155]